MMNELKYYYENINEEGFKKLVKDNISPMLKIGSTVVIDRVVLDEEDEVLRIYYHVYGVSIESHSCLEFDLDGLEQYLLKKHLREEFSSRKGFKNVSISYITVDGNNAEAHVYVNGKAMLYRYTLYDFELMYYYVDHKHMSKSIKEKKVVYRNHPSRKKKSSHKNHKHSYVEV